MNLETKVEAYKDLTEDKTSDKYEYIFPAFADRTIPECLADIPELITCFSIRQTLFSLLPLFFRSLFCVEIAEAHPRTPPPMITVFIDSAITIIIP